MSKLILATRKSPLALAQSEMVAAHLRASLKVEAELLKMVTTGDRQTEWSLEQKGGKGLFTSELEQALLRGDADVAVHSTKDLPGEMPAGLAIAGYMPRENTRDVLVIRQGLTAPAKIATGSPRRRLQIAKLFPGVEFTEIRGNVDTRLKKIAEQHLADATILAAAGMKRLGIHSWPGLEFRPLEFTQMVPAVGQGAIAIQCRAAEVAKFAAVFDAATARGLGIERALQNALGGGCHTAFGAHAAGDRLHFFHEQTGLRSLPLSAADFAEPAAAAARILHELGLK
ncbi:MAG TPA: hydroxymethylbilane synthase [Opitutaceae bacterium]|nr:hydroxymethylbilane synthase [Opitutaceae bacterium]HND61310.1 hydroxymethylbilane synthase [Opitutaceae bacterium]